jgi:hypothetical protein
LLEAVGSDVSFHPRFFGSSSRAFWFGLEQALEFDVKGQDIMDNPAGLVNGMRLRAAFAPLVALLVSPALACGGSTILGPGEIIESIELSVSNVQIAVGGTVDLVAIVRNDSGVDVNAAFVDLSWSSSNTSVATVDQNGVVRGESVGGPVQITASLAAPSLQASANVQVFAELPLGIQTSSLPAATEGIPYNHNLVATGGDGTYTWSMTSGTLPEGLSFGAPLGTISGTPTTAGSSTATFQVEDGLGATDTRALTIQVRVQSALHPNEPAGMTMLYENPGSYLLSAAWTDNSYNGQAQIVSDSFNPTGSAQAILRTHGGGGGGAAKLASWSDLGSTLGGQGYSGGGLREIYLSHRRSYPAGQLPCAVHSGSRGPDTGFKFFYMGMHTGAKQGGGANEIYLTACTNTAFTVQSGGGGTTQDWFLNPGWPPASALDTWHLELHLIAESGNGVGDGQAYLYSNGSLVKHVTGIQYSDPTQSGHLFDGMEMYHTADPGAAGIHQWLEREWYVSGK